MKFLRTFNSAWEIIKADVKQFSARTSPCPDSPRRIWFSGEYLTCAWEALAFLAVLPLIVPGTRNYFQIEAVRNHIGRMASNHRHEGKWRIVAEVLQSSTSLSVYDTWKVILSYMNPQDFFGNFVPEMRRAIRSARWKREYLSVTEDTRPVRIPQRKRGYDDKGSRRPSHKRFDRFSFAREELPETIIRTPAPFAWFWDYRQKDRGSG